MAEKKSGPIGPGWNPTTGCTRVSEGCDNCYAFQLHDQRHIAWKRGRMPHAAKQYHEPFSKVQLLLPPDWPDRLDQPLHWRKPRRIFVDSMADLFHEDVPYAFVDRVFAVMARTPQHDYRILTKRPERMLAYMTTPSRVIEVAQNLRRQVRARGESSRKGSLPAGFGLSRGDERVDEVTAARWSAHPDAMPWPLPNVWLGTSAENQRRADERIRPLLQTPAMVRFVSAEPLLGPMDLTRLSGGTLDALAGDAPTLDWVVVGGESGDRYRTYDDWDDWARSLRDQCSSASVAFYFKQHPARKPETDPDLDRRREEQYPDRRLAPVAEVKTMVRENSDDEIVAVARLPVDNVRRHRNSATGWNRVVEGDCRAVMERMPQGCADAVITDPPYNVDIDEWDSNLRWDETFAERHWHIDDRDALWRLFEGPSSFPGFAEYAGFTYSWAYRAYDLLKPGGHLLAFCAARESTATKLGLQCAGFEVGAHAYWQHNSRGERVRSSKLRAQIVILDDCAQGGRGYWGEPIVIARKPADGGGAIPDVPLYHDLPDLPGLPGQVGIRLADGCAEHAPFRPVPPRTIEVPGLKLLAVMGHAVDRASVPDSVSLDPFSSGLGVLRVYHAAPPTSKEKTCGMQVANPHKTVKPLSLMTRLVRLVTPPGGLVVDPMAGSGSTCVASGRAGCAYVGIELSPEYAGIARKRVELDGTW